MNWLLRALQTKPVYAGTAHPSTRAWKKAKSRRAMVKASRRANR